MSGADAIPDPAVVVLVGPSSAGKSTWAAAAYGSREVVSSDDLRAVVGTGEHDLDASDDAFAVLDAVVAARLRRGLTTVVDTLGLDDARRRRLLADAREAGLPAVAVVFDTAPAVCRARNRDRARPVPASALDRQLARLAAVRAALPGEGWDLVLTAGTHRPEPAHAPGAAAAAARQRERPTSLGFVLQVARFPWGDDPLGWLRDVARAAAESGFDGIALMDHLIQIPQVGRAWDPIPESLVTLGAIAGMLGADDVDLRLGTLVSPVTFRPPGVLAKALASLDALTGGRAFCGVGAGWWEREHTAYALDFPPAAERLRQLERSIEVMRALWAPGTKAYRGEAVDLPETTLYPRPSHPIPVIVGGGGERRTLRIAARLGDACNVRGDLATLARKRDVLRRHCEDLGRDPDEVELTVLDLPLVGADRDEVARKVDALRGRATAAAYARAHHAGTFADHVGRYRLLAEQGVGTVFVSLPDLAGPAQVGAFASITAAFR